MSDEPTRDPLPGDGEADDDLDAELAALLAERRAANPRRTEDREPAGAATTRRLLGVTTAAIGLSTLVLLAVLLVG
jgi:hypothetical protein